MSRPFQFLDKEDNEIWNRLVVAKDLDPDTSFIRVWDSENIQLDGEFTPEQLEAFVEAMRQIAERATDKEREMASNHYPPLTWDGLIETLKKFGLGHPQARPVDLVVSQDLFITAKMLAESRTGVRAETSVLGAYTTPNNLLDLIAAVRVNNCLSPDQWQLEFAKTTIQEQAPM